MPDTLRLSFSILLFLCSLLTILRAPHYVLWKLAVGITEFPHVTILLGLISLSLHSISHQYVLAGDLLSLAAIILFSVPLVLAYPTASGSARLFNAARSETAFRFSILFTGYRNKKLAPKTITYKKLNEKELKLDFYPGNSDQNAPCVIVVHGGSWSSGDSTQLPDLNFYLASKGFNVASINYRLAPAHICPAPVEDLLDAINFLKDRSSELKIDASNIILLGRSAGGQIALLAAYSRSVPGLKGVISFYAPADMVWGWSLPGNPLVLDSRKVMKDFVGDTCENAPEKFAAASPIEFVTANSIPTLLIHGNNECMVAHEHSVRLAKKLKENKVEHYLVSLPWGTHGCDFNLSGPSGQISTFAVLQFLNKICGGKMDNGTGGMEHG